MLFTFLFIMIKAIIIDDKPNNTNALVKLIKLCCPQVTVCGTAANIAAAYDTIIASQPDLIFLDIEMPEEMGLTC